MLVFMKVQHRSYADIKCNLSLGWMAVLGFNCYAILSCLLPVLRYLIRCLGNCEFGKSSGALFWINNICHLHCTCPKLEISADPMT